MKIFRAYEILFQKEDGSVGSVGIFNAVGAFEKVQILGSAAKVVEVSARFFRGKFYKLTLTEIEEAQGKRKKAKEMKHFTKEQLDEIGEHFGLTSKAPTTLVRDGTIAKGDKVWHRALGGPVLVDSGDEAVWSIILKYPHAYQIDQPIIAYKD